MHISERYFLLLAHLGFIYAHMTQTKNIYMPLSRTNGLPIGIEATEEYSNVKFYKVLTSSFM